MIYYEVFYQFLSYRIVSDCNVHTPD